MGCLESKPKQRPSLAPIVQQDHYQGDVQIPPPLNNPDLVTPPSNSEYDAVRLIRAVYSYAARESGDLDMQAGDVLQILDGRQSGWWLVQSKRTGKEGWVPSNYTAPEQSLDTKEWYYGDVDRAEADQLLTRPGMTKGTFLVRKGRYQGYYVISLLDYDVTNEMEIRPVKHYKVKNKEAGTHFFVEPRNVFVTLEELVSYYQENYRVLACRLMTPCPREYKPSTIGLSRGMRDKWEIPRESLRLGEQLGSGKFGEVYKALWHNSVDVAVKVIKEDLFTYEHKAAFLLEAETMKGLDHPKLVRLYAVCTEEEPFYIVTEYMANGSLLMYLRNNDGKFSLPILIHFAVQVATAMVYLESRMFIHRDLAARNVLVGDNFEAKVADFGMARFIPDHVYYSRSTTFPYKWSAPESLEREKFTHKSDVWSFGVLMYEILTHGAKPYVGVKNEDMLKHLKQGKRLEKPYMKNNIPVSDDLYETCMLNCWEENPEMRPSFSSLLSFLEQYSSELSRSYDDTVINGRR